MATIFSHQVQQADLPQLDIEQWLSPKEVAAHFGLTEDSAYRWIDDGTIDRKFLKFCGRRRKRIHPSVIPELEKIFAAAQK